MPEPRTIRVWADTVRRSTRPCRGRDCGAAMTYAVNVKSGRETPFTGSELVPLRTETDEASGREIYVMDFEDSHFRSCPNANDFSRGKRS